ncbi:MAG: hypothetical protein AAF317_14715 [Pseudomonadota bacterium]
MVGRVLGVLGAFCLAGVLFYLSRYWFLDLWPRAGLFGVEELDPRGGLLRRWLQQIDLGDSLKGRDILPFELLIWAVGGFVILTWVQALVDRLKR